MPEYIKFEFDSDEMTLTLLPAKIPEGIELGSYEIEVELTDSNLNSKIEVIKYEVIDKVDLSFLTPV